MMIVYFKMVLFFVNLTGDRVRKLLKIKGNVVNSQLILRKKSLDAKKTYQSSAIF